MDADNCCGHQARQNQSWDCTFKILKVVCQFKHTMLDQI